MKVIELRLRSFRNYEHQSVALSPNINYVVGNNGEGKTNLLEAMFVLATTRSHRQASEKDMVRLGCDHFNVWAKVVGRKVNSTVEIGYSISHKKKVARVSGVPVTRLQDVLGLLNVVLFSPDDLDLVKGSPAMRRRFLDILLCQVDKVYFGLLQHFTRVLAQRNEALKAIQRGSLKIGDLSPWDDQFSQLSARITERRVRSVECLSRTFKSITRQINQGKESLNFSYESSLARHVTDISPDKVREYLEKRLQEDVRKGTSGFGPHRDDLKFSINGLPAVDYASQGQQRTAVLGLKLAELSYMHEVTGDYPVLLLDDVLSELDQNRRHTLLEVLSDEVQALITGTDENDLSLIEAKAPQIIRVERGKVI